MTPELRKLYLAVLKKEWAVELHWSGDRRVAWFLKEPPDASWIGETEIVAALEEIR